MVIPLAELNEFALTAFGVVLALTGLLFGIGICYILSKISARLGRIEQALGCEETEEEAYRHHPA